MKGRSVLLLFLVLPFFTSPSAVQGVTDTTPGMHLFEYTPKSGELSILLNVTGTVNYDVAIVTTNNYHKLVQSVRSPLQLSQYPTVKSFSAEVGDDVLVYNGSTRGTYILVYSPDVLFNGTSEGTFTLSGDMDYAPTSFSFLKRGVYQHTMGNGMESDGKPELARNEYRVFTIEMKEGEVVEMFTYLRLNASFRIFVEVNRTKITYSLVKNLMGNYSLYAKNNSMLPSFIADFGDYDKDGGYVRYRADHDMRINVIIAVYGDQYSNGFYYFATTLPTTLERKAPWYGEWFVNWMKDTPLAYLPWAIVFLVFVSIFTSLLSAFVTKKLVDFEELNKAQAKINKHMKMKKRAQETADKKLWMRVQARDKQITELQNQIMLKRFLPQFILTLPLIGIFTTLRGSMGDASLNLVPEKGRIVAVMPFKVPPGFPLIGHWFSYLYANPELSAAGFGVVYFLAAIVASMIIQRGLGINIQGTRPESPFQN